MGFNKQNVNLQLHDDARFSVGFCFFVEKKYELP